MSDVGCRMSDVGCRMSDVGCRMSDLGCRMSDVGCRISDVGCRMSDVGCRISDVGCRMSDVGCRISDVGSRILDVGCRISDGTYKLPYRRPRRHAIFRKRKYANQVYRNQSRKIWHFGQHICLVLKVKTAYASITSCLGSIVRCFQFFCVSSSSGKGASYEPPPPSPSEFPVTFHGGLWIFSGTTFFCIITQQNDNHVKLRCSRVKKVKSHTRHREPTRLELNPATESIATLPLMGC